MLDSRVLLTASDAGALKARQLKLDANAFDTDEFLTKLAQFMGGRTTGTIRSPRKRRREVGDSDQDADEEELSTTQRGGGGGGGMRWELVGQVLNAESRKAATMDFMCVWLIRCPSGGAVADPMLDGWLQVWSARGRGQSPGGEEGEAEGDRQGERKDETAGCM